MRGVLNNKKTKIIAIWGPFSRWCLRRLPRLPMPRVGPAQTDSSGGITGIKINSTIYCYNLKKNPSFYWGSCLIKILGKMRSFLTECQLQVFFRFLTPSHSFTLKFSTQPHLVWLLLTDTANCKYFLYRNINLLLN